MQTLQLFRCLALCGLGFAGLLGASAHAMQAAPSCPAAWVPVFGGLPAPNQIVLDLTVWDDGSGPALYAGGNFTTAGGVTTGSILKWDGSHVTALPGGSPAWVVALAGFDDGSGPALFTASGNWGFNVSKWNGQSWTNIGAFDHLGMLFSGVYDLVVFDPGSGPSLYALGYYSTMNGQPMNGIARWTGTGWVSVGCGLNFGDGAFTSLVWNDGSGPALYVGGAIGAAGCQSVQSLARWNGTTWSSLPPGLTTIPAALAAFDDGSGSALYVGGFCSVGNPGCPNIMRWNGTSWSAVGGGANNRVHGLAVFDDGTGAALYAAGSFTSIGGVPAQGLAKWDGTTWSSVGVAATPAVYFAMPFASVDLGSGSELYVGTTVTPGPSGEGFLSKFGFQCTGLTRFCLGDGSATACPCGNASPTSAQAGCANSLGSAGSLDAAGTASISGDTLGLYFSGAADGGPALYFQGTTRNNGGAGTVLGDGLLCVGGSLVRLGVKFSVQGWSQFPDVGDSTLSVAGQVAAAGSRTYQVWYRDSDAFCTSATYNLTNAVEAAWVP